MTTKIDNETSELEVVNVIFKTWDCVNDRPGEKTMTRREYFDTPSLEGLEMHKHLKMKGFYPQTFSIDNGETWHDIATYCYANIRAWVVN